MRRRLCPDSLPSIFISLLLKDVGMKTAMCISVLVTAAAMMLGAVCVAQSGGEATFQAKCQMCHGVKGVADGPVAKNLKIKPASDPEMKKLTAAQMIDDVKNGKGRMPSFKDKLTDAQIKDAVTYFRSLK